tara:strand:- start:234274 stop:234834 length:561 start_codon:yes stop_codon:yes gene_type:complete
MRKAISFLVLFGMVHSCIPLRIAPKIDDFKLVKGKKFKRGLPKRTMFVFTDTKDAEEFYNYINTKFQLDDDRVYDDVPFNIHEDQFFFSFYEVAISDKSLNVATPFLAALGNKLLEVGDEPSTIFNPDASVILTSNYYIAIEVYSDDEYDCLAKDSVSKEVVLNYLSALKNQYLATHNYNEVLFKN